VLSLTSPPERDAALVKRDRDHYDWWVDWRVASVVLIGSLVLFSWVGGPKGGDPLPHHQALVVSAVAMPVMGALLLWWWIARRRSLGKRPPRPRTVRAARSGPPRHRRRRPGRSG
jgi:hypothetical protein